MDTNDTTHCADCGRYLPVESRGIGRGGRTVCVVPSSCPRCPYGLCNPSHTVCCGRMCPTHARPRAS